uniref:Uncharacterized protein n=1 Tax=Glossina morsitans morsitans TaxID=37546 RepID=A0A1B0GEM4_GLOMM
MIIRVSYFRDNSTFKILHDLSSNQHKPVWFLSSAISAEKCSKFRIYICDLSQIVLYLFEIILFIIRRLLLIIFVLSSFLTFLERKVLGYIQIRIQIKLEFVEFPIRDANKFFTKEQTSPLISNYICYYFSPIFCLFLSLLVWLCIPIFGVYVLLLKLFHMKFILIGHYNILLFYEYQLFISFFFIILPGSLLKLIELLLILLKWNQNKYLDLVLNIEEEVLLQFFLAEYARILFMRILLCVLFLGGHIFFLNF